MTAAVIYPVAPSAAAAANSAPMGALLSARNAVITSAAKGTSAVGALASKLHLGAALTWASRSLGWLVGRLNFLAGIAGFFGLKTLAAWLFSSEFGQRAVSLVARTTAKVLTYPVRILGRITAWVARKVGLGKAVIATQVAGQFIASSAQWVAEKVAHVVRPDRTWVQAVHFAAGFKMSWALASIAAIPTPISLILKGVLAIRAAATVGGAVYSRYLRVRAAEAGITPEEMDAEIQARQATKVAEATMVTAVATTASAIEVQQKAAEARALAEELQARVEDAPKIDVLENARVEHAVQAMSEDEIRRFAAKDHFNSLVPKAMEIGVPASVLMAQDVLNGVVEAHPVVMSRNEAKRVLTTYKKEQTRLATDAALAGSAENANSAESVENGEAEGSTPQTAGITS